MLRLDVIGWKRALLAMGLLISVVSVRSVCVASAGVSPSAAGTWDPAGGVLFIENAGQFAPSVRFVVLTVDGPLWLTDDAIWLRAERRAAPNLSHARGARVDPSGTTALRVTLPASIHTAPFLPSQPVATQLAFLRGADPALWVRSVPMWTEVTRPDVLPGVNLTLRGGDGHLTMALEPAETGAAGLAVADWSLSVAGADALAVEEGVLQMMTPHGVARLALFQTPATTAEPAVSGMTVQAPFASSFTSAHAAETASVDNETLLVSTFVGSGDLDQVYDVALGPDGALFATGVTRSLLFPITPGVVDPGYNGDDDAFVVKLSADGRQLLYATFLGGADRDLGYNVAVDGEGRAYVAGRTASTDFPTRAAYDGTANGADDLFLTRLSADGTDLDVATYLGGSGVDWAYGLHVDANGRITVAGLTESADFPVTPGALDSTLGGQIDAFVVRLQPDAAGLDFATYLGGSGVDTLNAVVGGVEGRVLTGGWSESDGYPTTADVVEPFYNGGRDGVVSLLDLPARAPGDTTNSLFGHVVDAAGSGLAGIDVTVGGQDVITDEEGAFTVRDLPAGVYHVVPARAGYQFSPAEASVALLPGRPSRLLNFTAVDTNPLPAPFLQPPLTLWPDWKHGRGHGPFSGGRVVVCLSARAGPVTIQPPSYENREDPTETGEQATDGHG